MKAGRLRPVIPRTIHQIWVGGPVPKHLQELMATWRELHPGWAYRLWTDTEVRGEEWAHWDLLEMADVYAGSSVGQFRADILRYEILNAYGGIYVDADFEAKRPLDELLEGITAFAAWEREPGEGPPLHGWINNAIMGAYRGHPWLRTILSRLRGHVVDMRATGTRRPNLLTGPQYITPLTLGFVGEDNPDGQRVRIFPKDYFYPYLWNELGRGRDEFPDAYAVHHWENRRRGRGQPR